MVHEGRGEKQNQQENCSRVPGVAQGQARLYTGEVSETPESVVKTTSEHGSARTSKDSRLVLKRRYESVDTLSLKRLEGDSMPGEANSVTTLLLADDDPDDRLLVEDALEESRLAIDLRAVEDGEELTDYLNRRGKYTDPNDSPRPDLILLDLKMPRKGGHQALEEIKEDATLRRIPVVVLTTSKAEEDIARAYDLGANSFVIKPSNFGALVQMMKTLEKYWFETVALPPGRAET